MTDKKEEGILQAVHEKMVKGSFMIQIFLMSTLFNQISDLMPPDLVTRELGQQAFAILHEALIAVHQGDTLVLDFSGIRVMDSSFTGGSLLKLLEALVDGQIGNRYLVVTNTNVSTEENINLTILGYGLKLGLLVLNGTTPRRMLGQIEPNLEQTLTIVHQNEVITARELADLAEVAINTASNRLKKLFDLHLVQRLEEITETGRQHVYQSIKI